MLVDLDDDTRISLLKYTETQELCGKNPDDLILESYNNLLMKYGSLATEIQISESETKTLYPLTEELMHILKCAGDQLGWYNSESAGYLFETAMDLNQDSLWMFSCSTVQMEVITADELGNKPGEEPGEESGEEPREECDEEPSDEPGDETGETPVTE